MKHCEPAATGQQIYGGTFISPNFDRAAVSRAVCDALEPSGNATVAASLLTGDPDFIGGRRAMPNGPGTVKQPFLHAVRALMLDLLAAVHGIFDVLGRTFGGARKLPLLLQRRHFTQIRATTSLCEGAIQRA
jgi:hypothetical protein